MKKFPYKILILILLSWGFSVNSQSDYKDSIIQSEYQKELNTTFEKSEWEKLAKNIQFDEDSIIEKTKSKKKRNSSTSSFDIKDFKYLFFFMALLLVIYIIYLIAKSRQGKNIKINSKVFYSSAKLNEEEIKFLDYEGLLAEAILQKNFKNAYRIQYLQCIKELILKNWIKYHKNDTNHELLNQLRGKNIHKSFKILTYLFDQIWYGEIKINEDNYNDLISHFKQFKEDLVDDEK
jgi:hypothetical protein